MEDDEHPELDFDPLDPTKLWYKEEYPWHKVGKMVLNKNPENYFAEVEQVAFGTGVLVDGLDFSDDKLLHQMVEIFTQCDEEYGKRVREGLSKAETEADTKMEDAVAKAPKNGPSF